MTGARIEESKAASGAAVASISGMTLMKGIFLLVFYRDDVMMIRCCIQRMTSRRFNKVYKTRRHGGLREGKEDVHRIFLSTED